MLLAWEFLALARASVFPSEMRVRLVPAFMQCVGFKDESVTKAVNICRQVQVAELWAWLWLLVSWVASLLYAGLSGLGFGVAPLSPRTQGPECFPVSLSLTGRHTGPLLQGSHLWGEAQ